MGHWAYSHPFKKLFVYLVEVWSIFYIFSFFLHNEEVFLSFGFKEKSVNFCQILEFHRLSNGVSPFRAFNIDLYDSLVGFKQKILVRGRFICLPEWLRIRVKKFIDKAIRR